MQLYHFTSLENIKKIIKDGCIQPMSLYNGKNVIWLTREKEKRRQYWAIGEHRDKTEMRITLSLVDIIQLRLPENVEQRQELFRLGAVNVKLWSSEFQKDPIEDKMNWYIKDKSCRLLAVFAMEQFDYKLGRYVSVRGESEEDSIHRMYKLQGAKWYRLRWNKLYSAKHGIKLGKYKNGQKVEKNI